MATVKGDVHDIGKNIVGVVLQCNNYDVVDLGVMVPAEDILDAAVREKVDVIGLSGLITPSLDRMVDVAAEMKRRNLDLPLLIGGATTSKKHTALRIAPKYDHGVLHVDDASKAVGVVTRLLSETARGALLAETQAGHDKITAAAAAGNEKRSLTPLAAARANAFDGGWADYAPPRPTFTGLRSFADYSVAELRPYIDWTPFFYTWEMKGSYPAIFDDPARGPVARDLYDNAQAMLDQIEAEHWFTPKGVVGFWPANGSGDDITVYTDETRSQQRVRLHTLRQQGAKSAGRANYALSDFVAPQGEDWIGGFAVTAGPEAHVRAEAFKQAGDDYNSIMVLALADRLAEAFAERMHERVRREFWAYAPDEALANTALIDEQYRGIRPAPGYPACPDHTEKATLFALLEAEKHTGLTLTESFAMWPAAAVSGFYFSHPGSAYFGVGRIGADQIADYAARKGMDVAEAETWLAPNLGYEPEAGKFNSGHVSLHSARWVRQSKRPISPHQGEAGAPACAPGSTEIRHDSCRSCAQPAGSGCGRGSGGSIGISERVAGCIRAFHGVPYPAPSGASPRRAGGVGA
jgi:5-methyltetrahydrofolate--homocysteine methyltransferase